ncbi:hypothetical protein AB6A40_008746 [Gnathostoma spinigerum]|uniref:Uncharacterized protein n=1 Tax=Gnathostoma spinigerum TaxID=75299 RepID=A0ABD6EZ76_9BILA
MGLYFYLLFSLFCSVGYARIQRITVTGQLACNNRAVQNVRVELRDHDRFDPDDSLAITHSGKNGEFTVSGMDDERYDIGPYIRIMHNCMNHGIDPRCTVIDNYEIPTEFINKVYDMKIVSLNIEQGRTVECS